MIERFELGRVSGFPLGLMAVLAATFGMSLDSSADWPEFRGPWANGCVRAEGDTTPVGLPLTWSESDNVSWKTPIKDVGWSTPVVMNGQIWLTTATEAGNDFSVIGLDEKTGKIFFEERLFHVDDPEPLGNNVNGYASPSPVVEPGRLYVHFGTYGTACIDTNSHEVLWQRTDVNCQHFRGPGSSLMVFENLLVLTMDGVDVQYVIALDKTTGETVWKTDRTTTWDDLDENGMPKREGDFRKSYSTPIVVDDGGSPVLVSVGSFCAFGYNARTGEEIWKAQHAGFTTQNSPIFGGGTIFLGTGYAPAEIRAFRLGGRGDIAKSHLEWAFESREAPETPSPIYLDGLVYTISNRGTVHCLDAKTGEIVWSERIGGNYIASPICADGRIYFMSSQGKTKVVKTGRTFELLAENVLDDGFMASPAVSGKALILRTRTHLYRIESSN